MSGVRVCKRNRVEPDSELPKDGVRWVNHCLEDFHRETKCRLAQCASKLRYGTRVPPVNGYMEILSREEYLDQETIQMDCQKFIQFATQICNDMIVFAFNASPASFIPTFHNYPTTLYVGPLDQTIFIELQGTPVPCKGHHIWGPWPDDTYVGFTTEGEVLWLKMEEWVELAQKTYVDWLANGDDEDRVRLRKLCPSDIEWVVYQGRVSINRVKSASDIRCNCTSDDCESKMWDQTQ